MGVEWGVMHRDLDGLHRGPMSYEEAVAWIKEAEDDGIPKGIFLLCSRLVGVWTVEG